MNWFYTHSVNLKYSSYYYKLFYIIVLLYISKYFYLKLSIIYLDFYIVVLLPYKHNINKYYNIIDKYSLFFTKFIIYVIDIS